MRVKQEEGGYYTIRASNEDDAQELSFHLQINGEDVHADVRPRSMGVVPRDGFILCSKILSLKPLHLWLQIWGGFGQKKSIKARKKIT